MLVALKFGFEFSHLVSDDESKRVIDEANDDSHPIGDSHTKHLWRESQGQKYHDDASNDSLEIVLQKEAPREFSWSPP
jgi:hypothetical protein